MLVTFSQEFICMNKGDIPDWVVTYKVNVIFILFHKSMSQAIIFNDPF